MATLQELIPYLDQGYTLQNVRGETLRMINSSRGIVESQRAGMWGRSYEPEQISLAEVRNMHNLWDFGVLFADTNKKPYCLTGLQEIEEAIQNKTPGYSYGEIPN